MLLAGGSGRRLLPLTKDIAKPVISYGGKYRIIDFALSNCYNSKIKKVGVLIQNYQKELSSYIGDGEPWGFNNSITILSSAYGKEYCGTANAVFQNIDYIKSFNPKYVLIVSGDHVYNMDYQKLIEFHKHKQADCTIAVKNVDLREASRFGIMLADYKRRIFAFEEKPKYPNSTLASMGIYVFNTDTLIDYLNKDNDNPKSKNDFGKNIIPQMVKDEKNLYAFAFDGFWKDVGTLYSLWDSNMNLLDLSYKCPYSEIYTRIDKKVHYTNNYYIKNSLIINRKNIKGIVINSILSDNVKVARGAEIINSVILDNCIIFEDSVVEYAILDRNVKVGPNVIVGGSNALTVIGSNFNIYDNIKAGSIISK